MKQSISEWAEQTAREHVNSICKVIVINLIVLVLLIGTTIAVSAQSTYAPKYERLQKKNKRTGTMTTFKHKVKQYISYSRKRRQFK